MPDWPDIFAALRADGLAISDDASPGPVGGGDISAAWRIDSLFVKTGGIDSLDMLQAEAEGLQHFGSMEKVYDNLDKVHEVNVRGAKTLGDKLDTHRDAAILARKLTGLACDAEFERPASGLSPVSLRARPNQI